MTTNYTIAESTGNKQDEFELLTEKGKYDFTGIAETWWDQFQGQDVETKEYNLFQRMRLHKRRTEITSYVKYVCACKEIHDPGAWKVGREHLGNSC